MNRIKIIVFIIISLATLILISFLFYSITLGGFIFGSLFLINYIIWLIIGIILLITKRKPFILILSLVNIVIVFIAAFLGSFLGRYEEEMITENAELIINKISEYKETNGLFPKILDDLYPEYIKDKGIFHKIKYQTEEEWFSISLQTWNCGKVYDNLRKEWYLRPCP